MGEDTSKCIMHFECEIVLSAEGRNEAGKEDRQGRSGKASLNRVAREDPPEEDDV